jgi:hypothetical protein
VARYNLNLCIFCSPMVFDGYLINKNFIVLEKLFVCKR